MTAGVLSPLDALESGWRVTRRHFWFIMVALLVSFLASAVPALVRDAVLPVNRPLGVAVALSTILLQVIFGLGLVRMSLQLYDRDDAALTDLLDAADRVLAGAVAFVLMLMLFALSMLPLVSLAFLTAILTIISESFAPLIIAVAVAAALAALYSLARFIFFAHIIVDHGVGPLRALRASADLTRRERGHAVALLVLLFVINLGGLAVAGIGLLVTLPLSLLTITAAYRRLLTTPVPVVNAPHQSPSATIHSAGAQTAD
ncbi:MAG: hypothetical protein GF331_10920 [Chitinivibrionales bacterium]|nr:hypothetical protein [Chitinivibrionales bacterium]